MVGHCILFTDKKTRVGVDKGSVGLVETWVFFYALFQCKFDKIMHMQA